MKISLIISETAKANPGESRIGRAIGKTAKPTGTILGLSVILQHAGVIVPTLHGKTASFLAQAGTIELELAVGAFMFTYFGGPSLMSLKEKLMKPLLDAQFDKGMEEGVQKGIQQGIQQGIEQGIEQGIATASAEFEAWKEQQRAAGAVFVPDPFLPGPDEVIEEEPEK